MTEPEGGWETAPRLYTSPITTIALCKFTGIMPELDMSCVARTDRRHADEDCLQMFYSADAITSMVIPTELPAREVRVPAGGEPTYTALDV
jgi:hypothetical protein